MDRSQWFHEMWFKAPHCQHISTSVWHACRVLTVVEDGKGEDVGGLRPHDEGALRYAIIDDHHRRDWRVKFDTKATRQAIFFPSAPGPAPQYEHECTIEVFKYTELKAIDQVFECAESIEVVDTKQTQEVFVTVPSFETLTPINSKSGRKIEGEGERMLNFVQLTPGVPPQPEPDNTVEQDEVEVDSNPAGENLVNETLESNEKGKDVIGQVDESKTVFRNGYALICGIANYPKVRKLPEVVLKDATDVARLIQSPAHCGYTEDHISLLLDSEATADKIHSELERLATLAKPDDTVLIFFSGHGGRAEEGGNVVNYLIPYDCDPANLSATSISGSEVTRLLSNIRAQKILVLFDCCYSGGTGEAKDLGDEHIKFKDGLTEEYYEQLAQGRGRVIMASSRPDEVSLLLSGMDNSLFTHYLLEALRGRARTRADGLIRVFDLFDYISEAVPARANQHPIFKAAELENNFPVSLYLGGEKVAVDSAATTPPLTQVNRRDLREAIVRHFSLADLEILCDDIRQDLLNNDIHLDVHLDHLGEGGKSIKVLRLIEHLDNRSYLAYLVAAVRRARPGII